jgi:hypothetical protein
MQDLFVSFDVEGIEPRRKREYFLSFDRISPTEERLKSMQLVRYLVAYEFTYFIGLYSILLQAEIDYYKDHHSTYENIFFLFS